MRFLQYGIRRWVEIRKTSRFRVENDSRFSKNVKELKRIENRLKVTTPFGSTMIAHCNHRYNGSYALSVAVDKNIVV